jgi:hypothetical protein
MLKKKMERLLEQRMANPIEEDVWRRYCDFDNVAGGE